MSKTTRRVYKIAAAAAFTAGSVVAIPATFAAEAPADQNGPAVAVAQHPNGEVNVEAATQNPAATETPKTEAPKAEAPKTKAPKAEAPKTEAPKTEAPKTEAPKTEAPKAEAPKTETPAPNATEAPKAESPKTEAPKAEAPKTEAPKTEQADPAIEIEEADFPADAAINTITVRASGFQGAKVGVSVNVSIYALDANQQVTGDPIATITVDANQIKDGAFNASFNVPAAQLPAGASYALVAVSNPQGQPAEKLVALSSFKVTETTTPRSQTPKADETPAPETPAVPEPQNATLTTESASLDPNDEYNVVTVNGAGFTHESASHGVQVAIYRLDSDGNITGEALAVQDVPASEIMEGTFTAKLSVRADRLLPGYVYALVATSDPNGLVHQVAVTTASVSDVDHPAPTVPAASNDDNTTVRDNGDGTTSVFTAKMSEDGSVTVTETRVPSSQAPRAKVGNTPVTASSQEGHTVSARDVAGRSTSDSSSRPQLAHTGAEGVVGIAGVGAAALIAGAALMLLRRRSL